MRELGVDLRNSVNNYTFHFTEESVTLTQRELANQAKMVDPWMSRITVPGADGRQIWLKELFPGPSAKRTVRLNPLQDPALVKNLAPQKSATRRALDAIPTPTNMMRGNSQTAAASRPWKSDVRRSWDGVPAPTNRMSGNSQNVAPSTSNVAMRKAVLEKRRISREMEQRQARHNPEALKKLDSDAKSILAAIGAPKPAKRRREEKK